jgi:hypothetical protein
LISHASFHAVGWLHGISFWFIPELARRIFCRPRLQSAI